MRPIRIEASGAPRPPGAAARAVAGSAPILRDPRPDPEPPRSRPSRVVVVGSVNIDLVVVAQALPGPGETVLGERLDRHGGGKGANAAVAAARLGADVRLVAAVGTDDLGAQALDELAAEGVGLDRVRRLEGVPTGAALIVVDADGENQIAVGAGANGRLGRALVAEALEPLLGAADVVLVNCEIPLDGVLAAVAPRAGRGRAGRGQSRARGRGPARGRRGGTDPHAQRQRGRRAHRGARTRRPPRARSRRAPARRSS